MLIVTLAAAVVVGLTLGLFGGGGSILTVPLLVYVAGVPAKQAIAMSLFVVGVTSAVSAIGHARAGRVRWRTGLVFGAAGMAGAYGGGLLGPHLPETLLLAAFALMMTATAIAMIRDSGTPRRAPGRTDPPITHVVAEGVIVGVVTGLVGAGGGFLVVPALVLLGGLPMSVAVGTSLIVIAMKSFAGLAGYLQTTSVDWSIALSFTAAAVAGGLAGGRLARRIQADRLRKAFGWFVLVMGTFVLSGQAPPELLRSPWAAAALVAAALPAAAAYLLRARRRRHQKDHARFQPRSGSSPTGGNEMIFTQYYLDCLSQASYLIGDESSGRAVVVDPRRDIAEYVADAEAHGLRIEGVINTHFHADFIAGHLELADRTGAWIGYGRRAEAEYPIRKLADGERIELGDVVLEIMETPGHTPESISVLVYEHAGDAVPYGVLTGDALFIGDVGRPDLLASLGMTADQLGRMLYDSVQRKLMALDDEVRVFPAHGAGSACGKNLSTELRSTIGRQRLTNYACAPMTEEEFLAIVTEGQPSAPGYFGYDAILNRRNRELFDTGARVRSLSVEEVLARREAGAVVLDARDAHEFALAHLQGSINVSADGRFAEWAGTVVTPGSEIVVVAPQGREDEVVTRLGRIGFDTVTGHLRDPEAAFLTVPGEIAHASRITAAELRQALNGQEPPTLLDVRNEGEVAGGAIKTSINIPLAELAARLAEVPADRPVVVYCAGGARSAIAASLLTHTGRAKVSDLIGGYDAWRRTLTPTEA
ncbi:TSUP family transporter [Sphaerimonospora sp. CA-214678]|uniref:TSUP family transporter n=1 Tax=Sphaerimonospora sp. CA-214678 TaxID=3240029 RepID=UPI003D94CAC0